MLEEIRKKPMERFIKKRESMRRCIRIVCPKVLGKLEKLKVDSKAYVGTWAGKEMFKEDAYSYKIVVKLNACTCTCKNWQRNGNPCIMSIHQYTLTSNILRIL